jgi:flagellar hook-associated protein 1
MSWTALQIGLSGTSAARRAMEVVSENVANVNTVGYSRRRVDQGVITSLTPMAGQNSKEVGSGVRVIGITRLRDSILDTSFRTQSSAYSGAAVRADVAARAEEVLGTLDDGMPVAMGAFWASWERLSSNPGDTASRLEVISSGERIATSLRAASAQIKSMESLIDTRSRDVVHRLNTYATQIAQLNSQIGDAVFRGAAPNDLLDQRDQLLDKIASLVAVSTMTDGNGVTSVYVGTFPLVDGSTANQMSTNASGTPVWNFSGAPVALSGELGALQEARDLTLPGIRTSLDEIALVMRDVVNEQHRLGMTLDGGAGGDFFTGTSAGDIRVSASLTPRGVAAGQSNSPADNRNALLMAQLGTRSVPGVGSVDSLVINLASRLGESAASTDQMARVLGGSLSAVEDQRQSLMGVSLDEELADLVRYQRAYEAAARVMQVADEMLDRLINGTGV